MPIDKQMLEQLALTARRVAKNMTDKAIADRCEALANDFDRQAAAQDKALPQPSRKRR
jgi:hypothetical protein